MAEVVLACAQREGLAAFWPTQIEVATCECGHRYYIPIDLDLLFAHEREVHGERKAEVGWYATPYIAINRENLRTWLDSGLFGTAHW